jgi:membrane protease YdiL (CAAX protease family)
VMSLLDRLPWNPLSNLRDLVERALAQLLQEATLLQIAALALAAGIGEEVLFRGFLQQGAADVFRRMELGEVLSQSLAIGLASLIFGLCHAVSKTYLVAATVIGALLGYLYIAVDDILAPIVAHAVYDFIAILYFVRSQRKESH